jgi:hypothetical protein
MRTKSYISLSLPQNGSAFPNRNNETSSSCNNPSISEGARQSTLVEHITCTFIFKKCVILFRSSSAVLHWVFWTRARTLLTCYRSMINCQYNSISCGPNYHMLMFWLDLCTLQKVEEEIEYPFEVNQLDI